jgi:hypothetical protein
MPEDAPGPALRLAEQLGGIVRAATAGDAGTAWTSALLCRRRPSNQVAATLRALQLLDPDTERVVYRIRAHPDGAEVTVTVDELDELIAFVATDANHEPDRRRQRRADTAFDVLNDAPTPRSTTEPMGLPELDVARVQRWCAARVPEHARHQVRVECDVAPRHLTIVERRAPWREDAGPDQPARRPAALHRLHQDLGPSVA